MTQQKLLDISTINSNLRTALSFSAFDFNTNNAQSVDAWASGSLKRNIESQMNSWAQNLVASNNCCGEDPPGSGFKITFGLQINLDYKVRLKANVNLGFGQRSGNFAGTASLHLSAYNGGLGVGIGKKDLVVDITAAANIVVGYGEGIPLQSYSLNYNSPITMLNNFKGSLSYGQLFTWNSKLYERDFSFSDLQREGMIGFRIGDVNVSSNNDTKRLYMGGGTDKGWTGGISIVTPFAEVGFQDFSGDYLTQTMDENGKSIDVKQEVNRDEILKKIEEIKKLDIDKETKKIKIAEKETELAKLVFDNPYHQQTDYQKNLNKASTYFRVNNNGTNITLDIIGEAWFQNLIHKKIKDFKFEYQQKKVELWGGISK